MCEKTKVKEDVTPDCIVKEYAEDIEWLDLKQIKNAGSVFFFFRRKYIYIYYYIDLHNSCLIKVNNYREASKKQNIDALFNHINCRKISVFDIKTSRIVGSFFPRSRIHLVPLDIETNWDITVQSIDDLYIDCINYLGEPI